MKAATFCICIVKVKLYQQMFSFKEVCSLQVKRHLEDE